MKWEEAKELLTETRDILYEMDEEKKADASLLDLQGRIDYFLRMVEVDDENPNLRVSKSRDRNCSKIVPGCFRAL